MTTIVVLDDAPSVITVNDNPTVVILTNEGPAGPPGDAGQVVPIVFTLDEGGAVLNDGIQSADIEIPFNCQVVGWGILVDEPGSATIDLWKVSGDSTNPPQVADTMVGGNKPVITNATRAKGTDLTNWSTIITADDVIRLNLESVEGVTRLTFTIKVRKI